MLGTRSSLRRWFACAAAVALLCGLVGPGAAPADAAGVGRTYTLDADFDEGLLVGLNHNAPGSDQLQLNTSSSTFPFIWVANSAEDTISKLDTATGTELGRYKTGPDGTWRDPSRTTVDLDGNVWVGNRAGNTVTKVGLLEAGNCVDRNGNSAIETSTGGGDVKAWTIGNDPADECILFQVTLPGPASSVRAVAVDGDNNVWAGLNNGGWFYKLDGATGAILQSFHNTTNQAYGAVVDPDGFLWIANQGQPYLTKYDPTASTAQYFPITHFSYGLGLDRFGNIWVSGWTSNVISKVRRSDGAVLGTYPAGGTCSRGVAVEQNGDVWIANSCTHNAGHLGNDGSNKGSVAVGNQPTGVAIDAAGKVWVTNLGSNNTTRIDPVTNAAANFAVGAGPYNYSDMTGFVVRNITSTVGTWTVIHDSGAAGTAWGTLDWNGIDDPGTTEISARVRAADTMAGLGAQAYVSVSDGALFGGVTGRYIQIEMTLSTDTNGMTPVLHDVTIMPAACDPALLWKAPLDPATPYDLSLAATLDIRFTWGGCANFEHDETVIILIVDPVTYDAVTAWVYGSDIVIDDVAKEYRQRFVPAYYGLSPGADLMVQVYMNYELVGQAPIHLVP